MIINYCFGGMQAHAWTGIQHRSRHRLFQVKPSATNFNFQVDYPEINIAREETIRWCDKFVVRLNLCPWASASMQSFHASNSENDMINNEENQNNIRSTVCLKFLKLPRNLGFYEAQQKVGELVRDEAISMTLEEGKLIMDGKEATPYNPDLAITFVVILPEAISEDDSLFDDWIYGDENFESFHDTVVYIEEEFLPSFFAPQVAIDAMIKEGRIDEDEQDDISLADLVAVAGFHPKWEFGSSSPNDLSSELRAVSFEKKSPYPTITIVHWSAIEKGSSDASEVTEKISSHNSKILSDLGITALQKMFQNDVKLSI